MQVRFTTLERNVIEHRLDAEYAIADALEDRYDNEAVFRAVERIKRMLVHGGIWQNLLTRVEVSVLRDCVEGSTWAASVYDPDDKATFAKFRNAKRTLQKIADKLTKIGINDVSVPQA